MLHPIKVVAKKTGLSPHLIRVWERRYGAVTPERSDTQRRMYSEREIERLKVLQMLTEAGHSIGNIATLGSRIPEGALLAEPTTTVSHPQIQVTQLKLDRAETGSSIR